MAVLMLAPYHHHYQVITIIIIIIITIIVTIITIIITIIISLLSLLLLEYYATTYPSTKYINDNDDNYFTKITSRLLDISLFKQTTDVISYGDDHYTNIRSFLTDDIGTNDIAMLKDSISIVRSILLSKSVAIVSNNCNNITISIPSSSSLPNILLNMDSCMYGPPGLDVGMTLAAYAYYMPATSSISIDKYTAFENDIRVLWSSYNASFVRHASGVVDSDDILQDTLRY